MSAATVAPVGMYVRPLIASAERWTGSRHRWSGIRARLSQRRQKLTVAAIRASASSASAGAARPSAHERAQYARSPGWSTCRAAHAVPLDPQREVGLEADRLVPPSGVGRVPAFDERPFGRFPAVVEDRLAHDLDLDGAVQALDRANEEMVGVVVRGRPGVRRDLVRMLARAHRQGVAHDDPPGRGLPGRDQDVGPRVVVAGGRMADPERREAEEAGLAVEQAPEHAG